MSLTYVKTKQHLKRLSTRKLFLRPFPHLIRYIYMKKISSEFRSKLSCKLKHIYFGRRPIMPAMFCMTTESIEKFTFQTPKTLLVKFKMRFFPEPKTCTQIAGTQPAILKFILCLALRYFGVMPRSANRTDKGGIKEKEVLGQVNSKENLRMVSEIILKKYFEIVFS